MMITADDLVLRVRCKAAVLQAFKHFPGQHDQMTHGGGGGGHSVITETNNEDAKILITQGIEPSFKPQISDVIEYAPGVGLEREGTYVANENAFSKGSFGNVRIHLDVNEEQLKIPLEQSQIGQTDIERALSNENGAVTVGRIAPSSITKIEVYSGGKWSQYSRDEYLKKFNLESTPRLPSVLDYRNALEKNKNSWGLRDDQIDNLIYDYNRGNLFDKINLAREVGLADE